MARIPPLPESEASPEVRAELERQRAVSGRVTNLKATLAHSGVALRALLQLQPLREEVRRFLSDREADLFAHAISTQTDCLICSTFFRKRLIESGHDPERPVLDSREQILIDYGRQLARDPNRVVDELFGRLAELFRPSEVVALTAFAGLLIATNLFNNALKVDLDEYLLPFRKTAATQKP
jgi:alkylhydroperoxidase family enzyme